MKSIVIFGKGGVGKSMIAANLSFAYSQEGLRVLHIGCDPKSDSTWRLTRGKRIPTVIEQYLLSEDKLQKNT
ncbi:MAG: AAA family ATPase [bacterium]